MYRLLSEAVQPFTLAYLGTLLAVLVLWTAGRLPARAGRWIGVGLVVLGAASSPITANLAIGLLERQFLPAGSAVLAADSIVVLGGGVRKAGPLQPESVLSEGSIVRTLHAAHLYHSGPPRPVVIAGGTAERTPPPGPLMAELLVRLGVPDEAIVMEDRSRTTHENAQQAVRLLRARGLVRPALVTEAVHMPRSVRTFRAQGVDVIAAGCNYRFKVFDLDPLWLVPTAAAASSVRTAVHEWIGMVWYWATGRL